MKILQMGLPTSSIKSHIVVVALFLSSTLFAPSASCQDLVFKGRETGFPEVEYSVTAADRDEYVSELAIPRFKDRSATDSRWMMCVYTNIAMVRKQFYWTVAYTKHDGDKVLLGFPRSPDPAKQAMLGPEFDARREFKQIMQIDKMKIFCEKSGYIFSYLK